MIGWLHDGFLFNGIVAKSFLLVPACSVELVANSRRAASADSVAPRLSHGAGRMVSKDSF